MTNIFKTRTGNFCKLLIRIRLSVRIKNPTSSVERLQLRLDEASTNKRVNEHMEEADKAPWRTRTRLRITDVKSADSGSNLSSQTSSSAGSWSNVSPRTQKPHGKRSEAVRLEPQTTSETSLRRRSAGKNEGNSDQVMVRRGVGSAAEQDRGEYYLRKYRRESRTPTGGIQVVQVRDYVYWPPERRKS